MGKTKFDRTRWETFGARKQFGNSVLLRHCKESYWADVGPMVGQDPPVLPPN